MRGKDADFIDASYSLYEIALGVGDSFVDVLQDWHQRFGKFLYIWFLLMANILLLNFLIALMGETTNDIEKQSRQIWKHQRASTLRMIERWALTSWFWRNYVFHRTGLKDQDLGLNILDSNEFGSDGML